MAEYVIESRTRSGQYLATLPFRDLQGEFFFSKTREIRFTMAKSTLNDFTEADLYPGRTEIVLRRNGVNIFCGPLWNLNVGTSEGKASLMAQDLSSYFNKRAIQTTERLIGTYGNIAWSMIATQQARNYGNLGITRGTAVPSNGPSGYLKVTRGDNVYDKLVEVSDGSNGFDWVFDVNRVYHQYYPRISSRAPIRLEYGGNIQGFSNAIQGMYTGNDVMTVGKDGVVSNNVVDTNSKQVYGIMDHVEDQTGIDNINLLDAHSGRALSRRQVPYKTPTIVLNSNMINPLEGDIGFGQVVTVVIDDGYTQYNNDLRCEGFQVSYGKSGNETFVLYTSDVI